MATMAVVAVVKTAATMAAVHAIHPTVPRVVVMAADTVVDVTTIDRLVMTTDGMVMTITDHLIMVVTIVTVHVATGKPIVATTTNMPLADTDPSMTHGHRGKSTMVDGTGNNASRST